MAITTLTDHCKPLEVYPGEFKDFDAVLRKFRKMLDKEGKLRDLRSRQYHTKPSLKRHHARQRARHMRKNYGV